MNFVTKNLGWILLLLFFIFMLYIISSSEKTIKIPSLGSGEIVSSSGSLQEKNLDDLIKMIDEDPKGKEISAEVDLTKDIKASKSFFSFLPWIGSKKEDVSENASITTEVLEEKIEEVILEAEEEFIDEKEISNEVDLLETEAKTGFFAKIFGSNDKQDQEISGEAEIVEIVKEESREEKTSKDSKNLPNRNSFIGAANENSPLSGLHIVKNTNKKTSRISNYTSNVGVINSTKIGDVFNIGVHSLKLNNKYFNETLGYLIKGDVVEQVSQENIYGCFEILVSDSKNNNNIGKKGYVCKKYLTQQDNSASHVDMKDSESTVVEDISTKEKLVHTSIGSYYKVELEELCFGDKDQNSENGKFILPKGDVLKQTSNFNPLNGCAEMKVVGSAIEENHGKTVSICSLDMVSPVK